MVTTQLDEVIIRVMSTPNPNALKFVMNKTVKTHGKATFTRPSEAGDLRLALDLFAVEGVRQLHFFENTITVTFSEETDIDGLILEVNAVLRTRMPVHDPSFEMEAEKKKVVDRSGRPPEIQKIEEILDRTVRAYLQGDGGDLEVLELKDHLLFVRYEGACGTCPSSLAGTLDAIRGILRDEFDPDLEIEAV